MKRIKYIDIAKGLAIILMVLGHCDTNGSIEQFVGLFNMTLFIFLGGYVYKQSEINSVKELVFDIISKVKKIYLFYLKYEIIYLSLTNVFFKINFLSTNIQYGGKTIYPINNFFQIIKRVIEIIFGMGREPFCGAFWYFISYIFIICMYSTIRYFASIALKEKHEIGEILISIIILYIGYIMQIYFNIPRVAPAFSMLIFYTFGCYLSKKNISKKFNVVIGFICLAILLILNNYGTIAMNGNNYTNIVFYLLCSFLGIYMVLSFSYFIEQYIITISNVLSYIGSKTIYIMAYHFLAFKLAMIIQFWITKTSYTNLMYLKGYDNFNGWIILYLTLGILIPLIIEYIINYVKNIILKKK